MAQDVGPEDVGAKDDESRKRRGGPLPLLLLAIVILVILWLVWQFLGRMPANNEVTVVTTTGTVDVNPSDATAEPETPSEQATTDEDEGLTVPDVVGDPQSTAVATLEGVGYVVSVTKMYSASKPTGRVITQNPSAGTALDAGGVVGITVSLGTAKTLMVTMPDIIGMTQSAAEAKVKAAGLKPYILYGTDQTYAGRVGNQWPLGGTKIEKGSEGFIQVMVAK